MKKKVVSIKMRLLVPLTVILLLQMVFQMLFYRHGGVMSTLRDDAVQIFQETTTHCKLNVERELTMYWMSGIQDAADLSQLVDAILLEQGRTPEDIATDPELNKLIVSSLTGPLIDILHYSYGNGIYMVLDGPASVNGDQREQAGVFIRDLDANSFEQNRADLLLERGHPIIAKEYGIALDRFWELGFNLDQMSTTDFYTAPFESAVKWEVPQRHANGCAYLSNVRTGSEDQSANLSYSLPLILSDGSVVGVVGGEISAGRIQNVLEDDFDKNDMMVLNLLVRNDEAEQSFSTAIAGSSLYSQYFSSNQILDYGPTAWDSVFTVKDPSGQTWYAALAPLQVYTDNTPFENDNWMVVRMRPESDLFAHINAVQRILALSGVVGLLIGLAVLVLASSMITDPIQRLAREMRQADLRHRPTLKKINIREIDELVDEINHLSVGVAKYASKVSHILDTLDMEIGVFEYESGSAEVFCSHSLLKLLGAPCEAGSYQFVDQAEFLEMLSVLRDQVEDGDGPTYVLHRDGEPLYIRMKVTETDAGDTIGVLMDVTEETSQRKRLKAERDGDLLTGLYNRRAFRDLAKQLLASGRVPLAAFVMWDMDNLKYVNDTYGHEAGDRYICMFAEHLRSLEQEGAIIERRSGDEFMAILYNGDAADIRRRIQRFMDQLRQITLSLPDGCQMPLRASAGVSWYPAQGENVDELARYADFAMYMSKHSYKGTVQEFNEETYHTNAYLLSGREELNQILEKGSVQFALQPIVARTGQIYGYEALMRPQLKKLKNITELLHLAKLQAKLPQIEELTWFGALRWISQREDQLAEGSRIFINSIANVKLNDPTTRQLEQEFPHLWDRVVLELTEMEESDPSCLAAKVSAVRRHNSLLALDDYGTGYNNESALLRIQPDLVKIDRALVENIQSNPSQQLVAQNLVNYSHQHGILVIAEGVETEEELKFLMDLQVDLFQGYYLARPNIEIQPLAPQVVEKLRELAKISA